MEQGPEHERVNLRKVYYGRNQQRRNAMSPFQRAVKTFVEVFGVSEYDAARAVLDRSNP